MGGSFPAWEMPDRELDMAGTNMLAQSPQKGSKHLYRFTIYALDSEIELSFLPTKRRFIERAKGHIIQQGNIVGEFE